MNRWKEKMYRFMQGRYGMDELGRFLLYLILGLMVISIFLRVRLINYLVYAAFFYQYYRMLSRNISKRYQENQKFLELKRRFFTKSGTGYHGPQTDATKKVFKCPSCKQKVRVPKGKGKISIHCPKCGKDFIKRT